MTWAEEYAERCTKFDSQFSNNKKAFLNKFEQNKEYREKLLMELTT